MTANWIHAPSPKDGRTYRTFLRNSLDEEWESSATADPTACNGWRNGKWQDWAGEVIAWQPQDSRDAVLSVGDCDIREANSNLSSKSRFWDWLFVKSQ